MRLLTFSSLFPNSIQPGHGPFVETRLRKLVESGESTLGETDSQSGESRAAKSSAVKSRVVAPVPWFPQVYPFTASRFEHYAKLTRVPFVEERNGLTVHHPRYPVVPKIGMSLVPLTMALAAKPTMQRIVDSGYDFDAIDAHYFYPDGVAAVLLGRWFSRPVVITARGSDITLLSRYALPRRMIVWAAREAAELVTVCQSLKDDLIELGAPSDKITVLRNGVDLTRFQPLPRQSARAALAQRFGFDLGAGPVLASVGFLIERKGHHLIIEALAQLPEVKLLIAGSGPERGNLDALAKRFGVADRVHFLGQVAQADLPTAYSAADALVLASSREGWANVLLEAMACGTPALATNVDGSGEVVAAPEAGALIEERTPAAIAEAVKRLLASPPRREATRRYAEGFSWDATTQGQRELFERVVARSG